MKGKKYLLLLFTFFCLGFVLSFSKIEICAEEMAEDDIVLPQPTNEEEGSQPELEEEPTIEPEEKTDSEQLDNETESESLKVQEQIEGHLEVVVNDQTSVATTEQAAVARVTDGEQFKINYTLEGARPYTGYLVYVYFYHERTDRTFSTITTANADSTGLISGTLHDVSVNLGLSGRLWARFIAQSWNSVDTYGIDPNAVGNLQYNSDYSQLNYAVDIVNTGFDPRFGSRLILGDNTNSLQVPVISRQQAQEGVELSAQIDVSVKHPDTDYRVTTRLYAISEDGTRTLVQDPIVTTQRSNRIGYINTVIPMGLYTQLLPNTTFGVESIVENDETQESYVLSYRQFGYSYLYVLDPKMPEETETLITVHIVKKDTKNNPVIGALLEILKDGVVVDSWTSDGSVHKVRLPIGDYVLVERSAPKGWKIAKPYYFSLVDDQADVHGYNYISYTKYERDEINRTYAKMVMTKEEAQIEDTVFCINFRKSGPINLDVEHMEYVYYKEYEIDQAISGQHFNNPNLSGQQIIQALRRVIYNGYLYDTLGLKEQFGLTDSYMYNITQNAVHYYTDGVEYQERDFDTPQAYQAYRALIECTNEPPENWTLKLYVPSADYLQTLVSAFFKENQIVVELCMVDPLDESKPEKDKKEQPEQKEEKKEKEVVKALGIQTGYSNSISIWLLWMMASIFTMKLIKE